MTAQNDVHMSDLQQNETRWQPPKEFMVIMHNDDYTTMDFVVDILTNIFHKSKAEATNIMMDVHKNGKGVAGIYIYDIAVTKKLQTDRASREKGFPLKVTIDEVENEA